MTASVEAQAEQPGSLGPAHPAFIAPAPCCVVELEAATPGIRRPPARDCGNAGPMDITERCPQDLGNLAQHARFPHFHSRLFFVSHEEHQEDAHAPRAASRRI